MFYNPPEIKGEIRNLKLSEGVWVFDIYFDDIYIITKTSYLHNKEDVLTAAIKLGLFLKEQEIIKRELAAVGNELYVKKSTNGYYGIYQRGVSYYGLGLYQDKQAALDKVAEFNAQVEANWTSWKSWCYR
jgi:hypothetical protein